MWLERVLRRTFRRAHLRMEEQWNFNTTNPRSFHLAALSRQNISNFARDLGGLDPVNGHHLFLAARIAISDVRTCAFLLGLAAHLHDQSFCRKSRGRRADGVGDF